MKPEARPAQHVAETVEKQLHDVINEVHERGPKGEYYDRDRIRKIAEEFSQKYVRLVRRTGTDDAAATPSDPVV